MKVANLMSKDPKTCGPEDTLDKAAQIFWECDCGIVPVVDEQGRAAGVLTDRDVCMAAYMQGKPLREIPVSTAMSKQVFTCTEDESVSDAAGLMREHQVRRIPVVNGAGGRLVGIVSLNDLALAAAKGSGSKKREVSEKQVAETLVAVCQPRREQQEVASGAPQKTMRRSAV